MAPGHGRPGSGQGFSPVGGFEGYPPDAYPDGADYGGGYGGESDQARPYEQVTRFSSPSQSL